MKDERVVDLESLTPVERRGDYWFKRDDLFRPFDEPLNGGKVRQALFLMRKSLDRIRSNCNSTVITVSSVHSPQGYLATRCAASLGLKMVIGIGTATPEQALRYPTFRLTVERYGARIIKLAGLGFNSVLQARMDETARRERWFPLRFGFLGDTSVNERQVTNLPDGLDHLVIPCGSGGSAAAILRGLFKTPKAKRPREIHIVQIAGMGRELPGVLMYNFIKDKTYPYSKRVPLEYEGLDFDQIYEAKAFGWLQRQSLKGRVCFWNIANFNAVRGGEW